jgi:hypothetical protein
MKENQDNYIKNTDLIKPQKLELKPIHMKIKINEANLKNLTLNKLKQLQNSKYNTFIFNQLKNSKFNININSFNILNNDFLTFLKYYFTEDFLNHFKSDIDSLIFETFENSLSILKKPLTTDKHLPLNKKIDFLYNTANHLYDSLENKLLTTHDKDLLNNICNNMDFGYINLEDYRSTKAINFFKLLEKSGLNLVDKEEENYIVLEKIIIDFFLFYNKFCRLYEFANDIKQSKFNDVYYRCKKNQYQPDEIFYIIGNIPNYHKSKYKLIKNIISIISQQFKINTENLAELFPYLIVDENKKSTIHNAKKQLINSKIDKNLINFLITPKF